MVRLGQLPIVLHLSCVVFMLVLYVVFFEFSRTAYDVSLVDDHWPQDIFDIISGNTSQSWERLDA